METTNVEASPGAATKNGLFLYSNTVWLKYNIIHKWEPRMELYICQLPC